MSESSSIRAAGASVGSRPSRPAPNSRRIFLGLFLVFVTTSSGSFDSGDTIVRYETARSFLAGEGGALPERFAWDGAVEGVDGRYYSFYGPTQTLLMIPFIKAASIIPVDPIKRDRAERLLISLVLFPSISALTGVVLAAALSGLGFSRAVAYSATLAFCLGSAFWHYARNGQEESLVALGFSLCLWGLARWTTGANRSGEILALGAILCGATRPVLVPSLLVLAAGLVLLGKTGDVFRLLRDLGVGASVLISAVLFVLGWNWLRFGTPFETGYQLYFETLGIVAFDPVWIPRQLAALLLSPDRGLLLYSPIVFLALWGLVHPRYRERSRLARLAACAFGVHLLVVSSYRFWDGGVAWGPRLLVGASVLLVPALAVALDALRWRSQLVSLAIALQLPSVVLPASTEAYVRELRSVEDASRCDAWAPQCGAVFQRPPRAWDALMNTLSGEYGRIEVESKLSPDRALASSDFRTIVWWPLRLAIRFDVWSVGFGWLLVALLGSSGVLLLALEYASTRRSWAITDGGSRCV